MAAARKTAKIAEKPKPAKSAKVAAEPPLEGGSLAWRLSSVDHEGPFGWNQLKDPVKLREIIARLHEFETKNWDEIVKTGSHPIECYRLKPN